MPNEGKYAENVARLTLSTAASEAFAQRGARRCNGATIGGVDAGWRGADGESMNHLQVNRHENG